MGDRALINQSYGGRQSLLDGEAIQNAMGGAQGSGGTPAPIFAVQPLVSPSSGTAGTTTFTATPGTVSNGSITSRAWLLNGSSISTGTTAAPATEGTLTYQEFATGAGGSASSAVQTVTVAAAGAGVSTAQQRQSSVYGSSTIAGTSGSGGTSASFTATFDGSTTMTVTAVSAGTLQVNDNVDVNPGQNFAQAIAVEEILTGTGGVGTYRMTSAVPARASANYTAHRSATIPTRMARYYTPAGVVFNRGLSGNSLTQIKTAVDAMSSGDVTPINVINQGFANESLVPAGSDTVTTIVGRFTGIADSLASKGADATATSFVPTYATAGLSSGDYIQKVDLVRKLAAIYPGRADWMGFYTPFWPDPNPAAPIAADQVDRMIGAVTSATWTSASHLNDYAASQAFVPFANFMRGADSGMPHVPFQEIYVTGAAADTAQTNGGAVGQIKFNAPLNGATISLASPSSDFAVSSIGAITRSSATVLKADYYELLVNVTKGSTVRGPSKVRVQIGEGATRAYNRVKMENGKVANAVGSASGTTLTIDSTDAPIVAGSYPAAVGLTLNSGVNITGQLTGTAGGAGTYSLSGSGATIAQGALRLTSRPAQMAQAAAISGIAGSQKWSFVVDLEYLDPMQDLMAPSWIISESTNASGQTIRIQRNSTGFFSVIIRSDAGVTIYNSTFQFSVAQGRMYAGRRKWLMVGCDFGASPTVAAITVDVATGTVLTPTTVTTAPVANSNVGISQPYVYGAAASGANAVDAIWGVLWEAADYIDFTQAANQALFMGADRLGVALPANGAVTVAAGPNAGAVVTPYMCIRGNAADRLRKPNSVGSDADQGILVSMAGFGSHPARMTAL